MDRVRAAAPTLVAAVALLGEQGARLGPVVVPAVSLQWALVAAVVAALSTKRSDAALAWKHGALAVVLAASFVALTSFREGSLRPALGIPVAISTDTDVEGELDSLRLEARRDLRRVAGRRRNVFIEASAILEVPRRGSYRFDVDCDDRCRVGVGEMGFDTDETLALDAGEARFSLRYRQLGGPARLVIGWDTPAVIELLPLDYYVRGAGAPSRRAQRGRAHASLAALLMWWGAFSVAAVRLGALRARVTALRWLPGAAAAVIVLYGCLLRFDALRIHSGLHDSVVLGEWVPDYALFNPTSAPDDPYRADVRSYLDRAETFSIVGFYAPSFREPFYIALTVPFLALSGGQIGILYQSTVFSCLILVLFFFVARHWYGAWWAVGLVLPVALHEWLVLEAPTGYRMSAYAFFLVAATAFTFTGGSGRRAAVGSGVLWALTCLIRLSALSVVAPILALRFWSLPSADRTRYTATLAFVLFALVGPFLLSNAVTHGDPFYSVSFHTQFWLRAEGLDASSGPVPWTRYFTDFGRLGGVAKGTALGMTALPVRTFWNGLSHFPLLGLVTIGAGVLGLTRCVVTPNRFLTAAYLGHLVPFAYIQNFPSGEMPRFVMPAYFFLVLAIPMVVRRVAAVPLSGGRTAVMRSGDEASREVSRRS